MQVLFLCAHGGAKSVIAASYFNRRAEELALPYAAVAASAEDPYDSVPEPVADFLQRDGFEIRTFTPRRVEQRDLRDAKRTVTIGCDLPGAQAERWDDVPAASDDLDGSVAAIRRHVEALIEELRGRR
jgi:arsenate reductase (thioredoxin)